MKYKHLFFDLDHTLWDYDTNARTSLYELYERYGFEDRVPFTKEAMVDHFFLVNNGLWHEYNHGRLTREDLRVMRFTKVFNSLGAHESLVPSGLEEDYLELCPTKKEVFDHTHEVLDYLKPKYKLHIITNGFNGTQARKMESSGLAHYFEVVITSETAGYRKPDPRIFALALERSSAVVEESLMIGDNLASDIGGARDFGMDQVFFNPHGLDNKDSVTHEINSLKELKQLL